MNKTLEELVIDRFGLLSYSFNIYGFEFSRKLAEKIRENDEMMVFLNDLRRDSCVILTNYGNANKEFLKLEKEILEYGYFEKIVDGNRAIYFESDNFELSLF